MRRIFAESHWDYNASNISCRDLSVSPKILKLKSKEHTWFRYLLKALLEKCVLDYAMMILFLKTFRSFVEKRGNTALSAKSDIPISVSFLSAFHFISSRLVRVE